MAARPVVLGLRAAAKAPVSGALRTSRCQVLIPSLRIKLASDTFRPLHTTRCALAEAGPAGGSVTSANTSTTPLGKMPAPGAPEYDTKNAAFLGEADSNDAFEAAHEINPPKQPALDGTNSAFLGEADSDDGFEAHGEIHGRPQVALDGTNAAFLGEADSDDGFEARKAAEGETDHGIRDPSPSAFHGESGEQDTPEDRLRKK